MEINSVIADALKEWADNSIESAKNILIAKKRNTKTNNLIQSITATDISVKGRSISIGIGFVKNPRSEASEYYKYVDQGVEGIGGKGIVKKETTGVFKFKNNGKAIPTKAIATWITKKPILVRKSTKQTTRAVQSDVNVFAYFIARKIKKTGLGKTMFWSNTFNERAYQQLADTIEEQIATNFKDEIGKSFTINIKI
jgi:predicted acetyltransferase